MNLPAFTNLDDDLVPTCSADRVGVTHTDEYGVTYICDHIDGLGPAWVHLASPAG